jgi:hypothetical protein
MKTPRFGLVIIVVSLFIFQLPFLGYAQSQNGSSIFAPFVSKLWGEVKNNLIRLTWVDSSDIQGPVYIYASQTPFDNAHPFYLVHPIEVPYGVQSYIDEVERAGLWHYFIVASDGRGQRYEIFMPFGNAITVTVGEIQDESPRPAPGPGTNSKIVGLEAAVRGDGILISFRLSAPVRSPVLYRSVSPITKTRDLLNAVLIEDGISSPFMDYPVPAIPYYYAVIAEDELVSGNVGIYPGYNATVNAVEVSSESRVGLGDSPGIRSIPLPLISVNAVSPGSGYGDVPPPTPLSPEAARAVNSLRMPGRSARFPEKAPKVFDQDLEPLSGGAEYPLRSIVQGAFRNRNWSVCQDELLQYLSLSHSAAAENRARFYLAQAYYFSGSYREALFEFLTVQSYYSEEAVEWIQATLAMLTR